MNEWMNRQTLYSYYNCFVLYCIQCKEFPTQEFPNGKECQSHCDSEAGRCTALSSRADLRHAHAFDSHIANLLALYCSVTTEQYFLIGYQSYWKAKEALRDDNDRPVRSVQWIRLVTTQHSLLTSHDSAGYSASPRLRSNVTLSTANDR